MNINLKKLPARLERAVEWRLERLLKNRKKTKRAETETTHFASQFRTKWGDAWYNEAIQENKIFYESFSGNGALCNPYAIFEFLLSSTKHANYKHVWALRIGETKQQFDDKYSRYSNVQSVEYGTAEYYEDLSTSKYLFNNATFPPAFTKRIGQIYINTWHGTPLKKMGYDMPHGAQESANILRNFVAADFLISPNRYTTDTMYKEAYRLSGLYNGIIIEEGYPRIDAQFASAEKKRSIIQKLFRDIPRAYSDKEIIVYAPTWKGKSFNSPTDEANLLLQRVLRLQEAHGERYQVLLKVHQRVYDLAQQNESLQPFLAPNHVPTNELLAITDVLITDYSSIFFDYLATGNPIIFFTPDQVEYELGRGLYLHSSELPGPLVQDFNKVIDILDNLNTGNRRDATMEYAAAYKASKIKFCQNDDGNSASRIIDVVMNRQVKNYKSLTISDHSKISLLIFLGGMMKNGITSSALNLLHNIDYDRYDVSVLVPSPTRKSDRSLYERIDPRARQFIRSGSFPATIEHLADNDTFLNGDNNQRGVMTKLSEEIFSAEWRRLFGDSTFDHIVDFSGYSGFWSNILAKGSAKSHTVWMHNNLAADAQRTIGTNTPNKNGLYSQFNSYQYYDKYVSVSPALEKINSRELQEYGPKTKFTSVSNTLDLDYIRERAYGTAMYQDLADRPVQLSEINLEDTVSKLLDTYQLEVLKTAVDKKTRVNFLIPDDRNIVTFVTAGRLSPEKNHARLIRAFAQTWAYHSNVRLIIMGEGPLMSELDTLIHELGMNNFITLAGHVSNPFEIMAHSDCFVLSSDYEGQPMVILEALALGIPVLTVDFGSVSSALGHDQGWIVPQTVEALASGMNRFVEGTLDPRSSFDVGSFNALAMEEFYSAISANY